MWNGGSLIVDVILAVLATIAKTTRPLREWRLLTKCHARDFKTNDIGKAENTYTYTHTHTHAHTYTNS